MSTVQQVESNLAGVSKAGKASPAEKKSRVYGKTIGDPKLTDEAKEYYEELKKKYSNLDFVLVSKDMKEFAKAQAGSYANPNRLVVLIDEEKIERMATDENYRKQYEAIIANGASQLAQVKNSLGKNASSVKAFGMQVDDGGNASFFAVVDKSLALQRERIEKHAEEKAQKKKADARKAKREEEAERLEQRRKERTGREEDTVTVTASSAEELVQKIQDAVYEGMSDHVWTAEEKQIGQHVDFRW